MAVQARALNSRRSAGGLAAACTGTAGADPNAAGLYAVRTKVSARTASDSVLNSERVKGSLRRFAPLTRCGTEDRDERRAAAKKDVAGVPPRARVVKTAPKQKKFDSRERVFFILRQALEATSKNALNYDACASGWIIYSYVGGNPISFVDPYGLNPGAVAGAGIGSFFGPVGTVVGGVIGFGAGAWLGWNVVRPMLSNGLPPGFWPGDKGSAEWGRRNGFGTRDGKGRFHGIKQGCPGSKPTDNYGVDPATGDVVDPNGDVVGNLWDAKPK